MEEGSARRDGAGPAGQRGRRGWALRDQRKEEAAGGRWCFPAPVLQAFPPLYLDLKANTAREGKRFSAFPPAPPPLYGLSKSSVHRCVVWTLNSLEPCSPLSFFAGIASFLVGTGSAVASQLVSWRFAVLPCSTPASRGPSPGCLPAQDIYEQGFCFCVVWQVKFQASRRVWDWRIGSLSPGSQRYLGQNFG